MNQQKLKDIFIKILKKEKIYEAFVKDFGKDFWAATDEDDGWHVDIYNNEFYFIESDVYMDHAEGYSETLSDRHMGYLSSWLFEESFRRYGYVVDFNGGDEEDFMFCFKLDPLYIFKIIRENEFKICELSSWCEGIEHRLEKIEK